MAGPAAIAIAGVAALVFGWNIGRADFVPYYSAAARSMFESWPAFAFGSFDPAAIAVLAMYAAVRRWAGPVAGLLAAALFAFTPVIASKFGHAVEDAALTITCWPHRPRSAVGWATWRWPA